MADDVSLNQALTQQLAARALAGASPQSLPLVQRSAYLADALRQIGQTGAQTLRTPAALGANLLADALDQWSSRRADAALQASAAPGANGAAPGAVPAGAAVAGAPAVAGAQLDPQTLASLLSPAGPAAAPAPLLALLARGGWQ
ncbi:MAG TPA: hypothetical protein VMU93_01755 [Caulobacteraceae bacterium]|nr:hypothetical protein [Caulobacteraceae bacterium]